MGVPGVQLGRPGMVKHAASATAATPLLGALERFLHPGEFMTDDSVVATETYFWDVFLRDL